MPFRVQGSNSGPQDFDVSSRRANTNPTMAPAKLAEKWAVLPVEEKADQAVATEGRCRFAE